MCIYDFLSLFFFLKLYCTLVFLFYINNLTFTSVCIVVGLCANISINNFLMI